MAAARANDERARGGAATAMRQVNLMACFVCGYLETDDRRFVPVLGGAPGIHYWLHRECLSEHRVDGEVHNAAMQDGGAPAGSADDPGECP